MKDMEINYTSLAEAVQDLAELESQLRQNSHERYYGKDIMVKSSGKTARKINDIYNELVKMEMYFTDIVSLSNKALRNIGEGFAQTEEDVANL